MRAIVVLTALPFVLITPVLAQNAQPNQQQGQSNAGSLQMIQEQVRNNLKQAGFTDIHIIPTSFLVRAKDSAGNPVMLVINPDSVAAVTEIPGTPSAQGAAPGETGQVTVPSAQNSGAGIPGQPGAESGPTANTPTDTTGLGQGRHNEEIREQDSAKIPGLPGNKSGPTVKPPSSPTSK
jgi:hypothetical protein